MSLIAKKISKILNFSPDLLIKDITITVFASNQASICGVKKILVYDDSLLVVSNNKRQLKILGSSLIISEMTDEELILTGNIDVVEFENYRR